jgi:glycosyltransferase involved in cell wall biosynthesis
MEDRIKTQTLQIEQLGIPSSTYASLQLQHGNLQIGELKNNTITEYEKALQENNPDETALEWLQQAARNHNQQYIAASTREGDFSPSFGSKLWLQQDIVPFVVKRSEDASHLSLEDQVRDVRAQFDAEDLVRVPLTPEREVVVSELVTLDDYTPTATGEDIILAERLAEAFKGRKLVFINATPQGGGVALMRHALIRYMRLLGVDAHWHILLPKKEVFDITKTKFHNVLQAVASPSIELTEEDKALFLAWSEENARVLAPVFTSADVIVIDDPQPAGLIPHIKRINPTAKILYRSHIQVVASMVGQVGTPQHTTWSFLWDFIRQADFFISHPMKMFVPDEVPAEKVLYMPATTDPLDGLNKPLTEEQMSNYLKLFNAILIEQGQTPLDTERQYIVQIARFDPSKGIPDVLDAYRQLRSRLEAEQRPVPQLIIAGNGSIDDPDGVPVYNLIKRILQTEPYVHFADDIKVARLPHRDQILNTLLRKSEVVLQLSIKEGFEVKVTEALMKGKPMIAYKTGGIPLQIEDNINGYLVEVGNTTQVSEHLYQLLTDEELYISMSSAAAALANKDYLTVPNAICWLHLAVTLLKGEEITGNYQWVKSLAMAAYKQEVAV